MNESSGSRPATSDCADYEGQFYTVMSEGLQGDRLLTWEDARKDVYDASEGCQVGVTANGQTVLMLVLEPAAVQYLSNGYDHWRGHQCPPSIETATMLFSFVAELLRAD